MINESMFYVWHAASERVYSTCEERPWDSGEVKKSDDVNENVF